MHNTRLDELQGGIKIARKNNNFKYADDTTLMAEIKEELKSLLMRVKEESEKGILKLNNKKTKIMASSPITSGIQPHHIRHPAPSHQASSPITSGIQPHHFTENRRRKGGSSDRFPLLGL